MIKLKLNGSQTANKDMVYSFQRLNTGNVIPSDIVLLHHEYLEHQLMEAGMEYTLAHEKVNKQYHYKLTLEEWEEIQNAKT